MSERPSERAIIFAVAAVQFVNVLEFMIVMPLGPDFAAALSIPDSKLGYVGGSYTAAACVSGLSCAFFLDRFDRRKALAVAFAGLVTGTCAAAFATGLASLMAARIVAGIFGGPATSLAYSIIADIIPPARRGRAMGAVMTAFSVASVFGVPAGLELARVGTWRLPFIAVAALGAVLGSYAYAVLPPMFGHVIHGRATSVRDLLTLARRDVGLSLLLAAMLMSSMFIVVPSISPYLLHNLHFPRERLGLLYLAGGCASLVTMRVVGKLVDRFGSARIGSIGTCFIAIVIYVGFAVAPPLLPPMSMFVFFMMGSGLRNVSYSTLLSKVPRAEERARFGSVQSAVQHAASALGAFGASLLLGQHDDRSLIGMPRVAWTSIALGIMVVPLFWIVERRVAQKTSEGS